MGTSTIYLRYNDLKRKLRDRTKEELDNIDALSPHKESHAFEWHAPLELHNGNVYPLIFWKGKLMRLDKAPFILNNKYYDKYSGKYLKIYEWTLLKKLVLSELERADNEFKKHSRKKKILKISDLKS